MCTFNLDNLLDMSDKTDGPPPAKRFKRDYTESITVPIGPEEKSFVVHKEAVCAESPFFKAACSKKWEEGQEGIVRLSTADIDSFQAFIHWIYTKEIDLPTVCEGKQYAYPTWLSFGRFWALAHYLDSTRLRDAVIDAMISKVEKNPGLGISVDTLKEIFDITPENSTIQRLLSRIASGSISVATLSDKDDSDKIPLAILKRMAKCFAAGLTKGDLISV